MSWLPVKEQNRASPLTQDRLLFRPAAFGTVIPPKPQSLFGLVVEFVPFAGGRGFRPMKSKARRKNLLRIKATLKDHADTTCSCAARRAANLGLAGRLARRALLCRSDNSQDFESIAQAGQIVPQSFIPTKDQALTEESYEKRLGYDNCVYFYCGAARYPRFIGPCAILMTPEFERGIQAECSATPFDTGAILHFSAVPSGRQERSFCAQMELPVPSYRTYLANFTACSFKDPRDYYRTDGEAACLLGISSVDWPVNADARKWTVEVRIPKPVGICRAECTVVVPHDVATDDWALQLADSLKAVGGQFKTYRVDEGQFAWSEIQDFVERRQLGESEHA